MPSNLVTPPDFVNNNNRTAVVINATWDEIESLHLWLATAFQDWNIYFYNHTMENLAWLEQAVDRAEVVVVNQSTSNWDISTYSKVYTYTESTELMDFFNSVNN